MCIYEIFERNVSTCVEINIVTLGLVEFAGSMDIDLPGNKYWRKGQFKSGGTPAMLYF